MRSFRWFATAAVGSLCLLAAAACGDDDDDGADIDAGIDEQIDAGADIDAEPPPPENATVTVIDDGEPVPDVDVVFHDSDGTPLETIATGKDGKASRQVPADAIVTVALVEEEPPPTGTPSPISAELFTIFGVQPGDDLVVGAPAEPDDPEFVPGTVQVQMPDEFAGADEYSIHFGCVSATELDPGELFTINLTNASCLGTDGKFDVLATALTEGNVSAYSFATDVDFVPGGTAAVVNLPAFAAPVAFDATVVNPPPMIAESLVDFGFLRDFVRFDGVDDSLEAGPFARLLPDGFYQTLSTVAIVLFADGRSGSMLFRDQPLPSGPVEFDGADLLPRIAGVIISSPDVARPTVTLFSDGDLSGADGALGLTSYETDTASVSWQFLFPPSRMSLQAPELPEELAELRPTPQSVFDPPTVFVFESTLLAGYDALRNELGFQVIFTPFGTSGSDDATVRVSIFNGSCSAAGGGGAGLGSCLALAIAGLLVRRRRR